METIPEFPCVLARQHHLPWRVVGANSHFGYNCKDGEAQLGLLHAEACGSGVAISDKSPGAYTRMQPALVVAF
jgi:hypothetical protein